MNHSPDIGRQMYPRFATTQGERWRRFLQRVGTRSNDFASRGSRTPFVHLQRRTASTTTWRSI